MKRRQRLLLPEDGTKLILLDKRYGNKKKETYMVDGQTKTVNIVHTSFDIEETIYKDFIKKILDDLGFVNKKAYVMRVLIAAYTYGVVTREEIEEKLEKLDKEIFI